MSKVSQIHSELEEQATKLGFESLEMAQEAGCEVEWHEDSAELVEPLVAAHRAWEKEKEEVLKGLLELKSTLESSEIKSEIADGDRPAQIIEHAYKFIEEAHE